MPQDSFPVVGENLSKFVDEKLQESGRSGANDQHSDADGPRQIWHKEPLHKRDG